MNSNTLPEMDWQAKARFWSKVDVRNADECWPWRAGTDTRGYGAINISKRVVKAHRVAYSLANGDMPADLLIRHQCDNPACCNPHHLLTGTPADNVADCIRRGRNAFGERVPNAKLNDEQALSIWGMKDTLTAVAVGRMFGVSEGTVRKIWYGETWKHITQSRGSQ